MVEKLLADLGREIAIRPHYDNYIGGKWVPAVKGQTFQNISPIDGNVVCTIARSTAEDVELALDAAHAAKDAWGDASPAERSLVLLRIADRIEQKLDVLAMVETIDNGKPIRETKTADLPLAVDHFRYFAGVLRAQEGGISEIDHDTIAYHFHEPLGVVAQIIPWNFPLLMAVWKIAPGARRRQLHRLEAGRADADEHHGADGRHRRLAAARRPQRHQRLRRRMRQAAGAEPAHRQGRLHRRDDDGAAHHAIRHRRTSFR